ncbi:hypothetical protein [Desulfatitalea tepidiphila]|uniref:hypothetical protein n=1 Tax=Desulfatitalea tepidiphila TaxID=1185843 RepID=UPI00128F83B0|nr:hypothetical protein [Desulfatitalea tepidiphila]
MVLGVIGIFKPPRKEHISSPLARDEAGCFVLLTNLWGQQANCFYDDYQVLLQHGYYDGETATACKPLKFFQLEYLKALGVPSDVFTVP